MRNDDLISRFDLLSALKEGIRDAPLHIQATVNQYIDEAPVVEAAPVVHGYLTNLRDCSICGCYNPIPCYYCRKCGAKLDKKINKEVPNGVDKH